MHTTTEQEITKSWWGPVWRGLVVDRRAQHQRMRGALWLFLYCLIHCDRVNGHLMRRTQTIATDMGVPLRTVRHWVTTLRRQGYIETKSTGRSLTIHILKWKPIVASARAATK